MTERRVKPLPFIQTGSGANALVFIHGFLDDGSFWLTTIQVLVLPIACLPAFSGCSSIERAG